MQCSRRYKTEAALQQHMKDTHDNPDWNASRLKEPTALQCPCCGSTATMTHGKFGMKAECCGLWSWNYKPLVNRGTHAARIKAHEAFDALWKNGHMTRKEAYHRLRKAMEMTVDECHMSYMTEKQAKAVVSLVDSGVLLRA